MCACRDREDVAELARYTYGGHDYIVRMLSEWCSSPLCETLGIEIEGRLDFAYTHVTDAAAFGDTVVHGPARFTSARFDADPSLTEAALGDTVAAYDISVEPAGGS